MEKAVLLKIHERITTNGTLFVNTQSMFLRAMHVVCFGVLDSLFLEYSCGFIQAN